MPKKIDASRIEQFLHANVETEKLRDRELALVLQVSPSTVTHWRHKVHMPPADKFTCPRNKNAALPVRAQKGPLTISGLKKIRVVYQCS